MRKMLFVTLATASLALGGAASAATVAKPCHNAKGHVITCPVKTRHMTKTTKAAPAKSNMTAVHKTSVTTTKKTS